MGIGVGFGVAPREMRGPEIPPEWGEGCSGSKAAKKKCTKMHKKMVEKMRILAANPVAPDNTLAGPWGGEDGVAKASGGLGGQGARRYMILLRAALKAGVPQPRVYRQRLVPPLPLRHTRKHAP